MAVEIDIEPSHERLIQQAGRVVERAGHRSSDWPLRKPPHQPVCQTRTMPLRSIKLGSRWQSLLCRLGEEPLISQTCEPPWLQREVGCIDECIQLLSGCRGPRVEAIRYQEGFC